MEKVDLAGWNCMPFNTVIAINWSVDRYTHYYVNVRCRSGFCCNFLLESLFRCLFFIHVVLGNWILRHKYIMHGIDEMDTCCDDQSTWFVYILIWGRLPWSYPLIWEARQNNSSNQGTCRPKLSNVNKPGRARNASII